MAIADTIQSMYDNVGEVYDTITNVDLPTNKNIQNIPSTMRSSYLEIMNNGIDKIWNNWEKVTGEGETLTLNSTAEAPMTIALKGNASQETTTGKNLLENTLQSQTANGITFIRNNDGSLTFSGTATQAHSITGRFTKNLVLRAGTTYILSLGNKQAGYGVYLQKEGNANVWYLGVGATNSNLTITPTEDTTIVQLAIHFPNGNTVNGTIYPMIRLASITNDTYEPYTNGASPNPDYPQDIHVVSGDNSINVCGKNLADYDNNTNLESKVLNSSGVFESSSYTYINGTIKTSNNKITISFNNRMGDAYIRIGEYKTDGTFIKRTLVTTTPTTLTLDSNTSYIIYSIDKRSGVYFDKLQIEMNDQATTYEEYKGASYPINLGVKNLIDFNRTAGVFSGNGTTFEETKYFPNMSRDSGTGSSCELVSYADNVLTIKGRYGQGVGFPIRCKPNQSYFVKVTSADSNARLWLSFYDNTGTFISGSSNDSNLERSVTSPSNSYWVIPIFGVYGSSLTNVEFSNIKVLEGNKEQTISPTPIELCKIGDYQDSIKKSTGKNLFNSELENGGINSANGEDDNRTDLYNIRIRTKDYIPVNDAQMTLSWLPSNLKCYGYCYDNSKTFLGLTTGWNDTPFTFTPRQNTAYIRIVWRKSTNDTLNVDEINYNSIQLEKGNQATTYEPYGKVWYLNKQIGKYTITGQESATQYYWSSEINGIKFVLDDAIKTVANVPTYCNRFNQWYSGTTANNYVRLNRTTSYLGFWFGNITIEGVNSITTFKSYATNNQILLYYPLATPTYTEITDSTLLSQLEALNGAKSYTSQTNISQENNDLPFILDATALKQLTQ